MSLKLPLKRPFFKVMYFIFSRTLGLEFLNIEGNIVIVSALEPSFPLLLLVDKFHYA